MLSAVPGPCCCAWAFSGVLSGPLVAVASAAAERSPRPQAQRLERRLSSRGSQALKHRPSSCGAWSLLPTHMESSSFRSQTRVPCISRWILNHWATRKVPGGGFKLDSEESLCVTPVQMCVPTVIFGKTPPGGRMAC